MKVLQVNVVYKIGSTGKIMYDIHTGLLNRGIDSVVCYSRSYQPESELEYRICTKTHSHINVAVNKVTGLTQGGCIISTHALISIIKSEKPDIVHLQCINGAFVNIPKLISFLKHEKNKTVLTLHAEFMYTGGCGYAIDCNQWSTREGCGHPKCPRWRKETGSLFVDRTGYTWEKLKEAFDGFDDSLIVVGVSDWIVDRANHSPIFMDKRLLRIHNGIKLDVFRPYSSDETEQIKAKYNIPRDKRIVLSVNPRFYDPVKGGVVLNKIAKNLPSDYKVLLVGQEVETTDFISISYTENQIDLAKLYSAADVYIHTSIVDNYPTVCIEANCCGTPVVGFDVGGVKETIGENMGEVVERDNVDRLIHAVLKWSRQKHNLSEDMIERRRHYCDRNRMTEDYIRLYKNFDSVLEGNE